MGVKTLALPDLIESQEVFEELIRDLGREARLAVDTESNSLHAYRERVCLIQLSTVQRDYVIDPLAVNDLQSLGRIFADRRVEKIFHASEYDLICLRRDYGFSFAKIFDTMQAGRILGRKQGGLDRLLEEKFDVKINKRYQKADWGVRPLSRDLLLYAAVDTHYLIQLRDLLEAELEARGLWQLAQEDFQMACDPVEPKAKSGPPAWPRFSMRRDLDPRELTVLKELLDCREDIAGRLDRPPFKVLDDDRLVEIARAKPTSLLELADIGMGRRQSENWGQEILEAVERGQRARLVERKPPEHPSAAYLKRLDKLKAWRKKAAAGMDVESDVILPRGLLLALAETGPSEMQAILKASPWRLSHFGDQIRQVLEPVP